MEIQRSNSLASDADAKAQLSAVVRACDDAIIATDLDGIVMAWSQGATELYGYAPDGAIGRHISFVYPEGEISIVDEILEGISQGEQSALIQGVRLRADGSMVTVELRVSPIIDEAGVVIGASSIARDIGDRIRGERELRESREFLERTQSIGHIGSWKTSIGSDEISSGTPEAYRILGIAPGTRVRNSDLLKRVHPDDRRSLERMMRVRNDGRRAELEVRFTRADGAPRWLFFAADALLDETGTAIAMAGVVQDITQRKEAELHLEHDALHDQLTGLPNRILLLDRVERALERARRDGSTVALFYVDLDRFKLLNDANGTEYGDDLLKAVAERLRFIMRNTDTVARFGADEFGLVSERVANASDTAERAERILEAIAEPLPLGDGEARITASIGIALSTPETSAESMVRDAGLAMHRAKEQGRNRFELYDPALRDQVHERFALEAALRRALENDELFLVFQPIVSLSENRYVAAEALLRWHHPERGIVQPGAFIPVAEDTGLIVPIGTWALDAACQQLRRWYDESPDSDLWWISVNVAAAQLGTPEFPDLIAEALKRSRLAPSALRIEITESALIEESGIVTNVLERIRSLGVRISIDDFGTKYSALSYLARLPIDELKIDRSFVSGIVSDRSNRAIISAIVAIGHSLNLGVTAEGIETKDQLAELDGLGCDLLQGQLFADAMTPEMALEVLKGLVR